jgi:hypothetical protein
VCPTPTFPQEVACEIPGPPIFPFAKLQTVAARCEASAIISAILEAAESLDNDGHGLFFSYISDDTAHKNLLANLSIYSLSQSVIFKPL